MKEFSEKELEDQYKNWKMMDVPPMWEEIEKKLAPKEKRVPASVGKRKRVPMRRMAAAAAILCVLLLGPAWYQIRKGLSAKSELEMLDHSSSADGAWEEEASGSAPKESQDTAESPEAGLPEGAADDSLSGEFSNENAKAGEAEGGALEEETGEGLRSEAAADKEVKDETASDPVFQAKIQVKEVQVLEQGLQVAAWMIEPGDGPVKRQEEVVILYEGAEYQETDFSGILNVRLQGEENYLKLLEILP